MATEQEQMLRTKLKYATIALVIVSSLLVGGWIIPDVWLAAFKVLFGGILG